MKTAHGILKPTTEGETLTAKIDLIHNGEFLVCDSSGNTAMVLKAAGIDWRKAKTGTLVDVKALRNGETGKLEWEATAPHYSNFGN
jgi:hypothetical protein